MRLVDRTGDKYGRLAVLHREPNTKSGRVAWLCGCDCGEEVVVLGEALSSGDTRSCGCLQREEAGHKHGLRYHQLYDTWLGMKQRCTNINHKNYDRYGGRGIQVCDEWMLSFPQFLADMGEKDDPSLSIDRIDNDKGYYPENCRWATPQQQRANQ